MVANARSVLAFTVVSFVSESGVPAGSAFVPMMFVPWRPVTLPPPVDAPASRCNVSSNECSV